MFTLKRTKERRCGLKPQRRKDRKILHGMLGKTGIFVPFVRFVFIKTGEKSVFISNLKTIMKPSYFKIC